MNTHTILFHVTCRTLLSLTPEVEKGIYSEILDTMNGDLLYGKNPSKEIILEAYHNQHNPFGNLTWLDLVQTMLPPMGYTRLVCKNTGA